MVFLWVLVKEGDHFDDYDAFSVLRKQSLDYSKNVNLGYLNINSLQNKFDSRSKLNKGKVGIFLINKFKLRLAFIQAVSLMFVFELRVLFYKKRSRNYCEMQVGIWRCCTLHSWFIAKVWWGFSR